MQHRRPRLTRKAKIATAAATALAAGASVTVAMAGEEAKKCAAFDTITMGKYYVNNNLWGQDKGKGTQCVWDNSHSGSTISWGTDVQPGEEAHLMRTVRSARVTLRMPAQRKSCWSGLPPGWRDVRSVELA
jgi:hypothetical protein